MTESKSIAGRAARLAALAEAYEPGNYALCDGVYHVYANVPECCQTLRDDIRWALELALNQGEEFLEFKEALRPFAAFSPRYEGRTLNVLGWARGEKVLCVMPEDFHRAAALLNPDPLPESAEPLQGPSSAGSSR